MPKGLIRFASEEEIAKKEPFRFTARMKGYASVLTILIGILIGLLFLRSDVQANILRLPGQLYQKQGDMISNVYTYKIINKTTQDFDHLTFKIVEPKQAQIEIVGNPDIHLGKQGLVSGTLFIKMHQAFVTERKLKLKIEVYRKKKKKKRKRIFFFFFPIFRFSLIFLSLPLVIHKTMYHEWCNHKYRPVRPCPWALYLC